MLKLHYYYFLKSTQGYEIICDAQLHRIIIIFFFGVFTSFTLSDSKYTLVDVAAVHTQDVITATIVIMAKKCIKLILAWD